MATQEHNSSILDLEPDTLIELYEVDLGEQDGIYRFHPGKNNLQNIFLRDEQDVLQTFYSLPIESNGFELKTDGTLPRPKLVIVNPQGTISDLIKTRNDLVGNYITRKRIFMKFLDNENFPNNFNPFSEPNSKSRFPDDLYIINKKTQENKYYVEFELISPLEFEEVQLPARLMIADYCPWTYRGKGCLYGSRIDFDNQSLSRPNGSVVSVSDFFQSENDSGDGGGPNIGLPIADSGNKLFSDPKGYNLNLKWQGYYDNSAVSTTANNYVSIVANGAFSDGATSINIDSLGYPLASGSVITFAGGSTFTLDADAAYSDTTLSGVLSGDIDDDETGTALKQTIYASISIDKTAVQVTLSADTNSTDGSASYSISVDALTAAISSGDQISFSPDTYIMVTANASIGATTITGYLISGEVGTTIFSGSVGIIKSTAVIADGAASIPITSSLSGNQIVESGAVFVFSNGSTFTSDMVLTSSTTTFTGSLSGSVSADLEGVLRITLPISAAANNISKSRTIVFPNGVYFVLTQAVTSGDTSITGTINVGNTINGNAVGTLKYVPGDCVRITARVENLSKIRSGSTQEFTMSANPDSFYVCIKEVEVSKSPIVTQTAWILDQCGKNLYACRCRYVKYGTYERGLPFGGFPSIERYNF